MPRDLLKIYNVVSTPGRREFYPHYHSDLEIAYFSTGRGVYSVTGREYPIGEGDIFIFSNNEIHKITYVDPEVKTRALNIHFPPRLLLMPLSLFPESGAARELSEFFLSSGSRPNRITRESAGRFYDDIVSSLLEAEREMFAQYDGAELLAYQALVRALVLIKRLCRESDRSERETDSSLPSGLSPKRIAAANVGIAAVLEYIDGNCTADLSVNELCRISSMSRSNFERMFRRFVGVPVSDYIRRRRVDAATNLLVTTDMTILDVALAVGYHNTANFNKQFRAVTGKTPGEYRREYREM